MPIIPPREMDGSGFSDGSGRSEKGVRGFEKKRRSSEEDRERFW